MRKFCVSLHRILFILICLLSAPVDTASGEEDGAGILSPSHPIDATGLSKDELLNQLAIRQAQLELENAKSEMERAQVEYEETKSLFEEKIVTIDTFNKARQAYQKAILDHKKAAIELEKTRLDFLKDATLITVEDARKFRTEDGQFFVTIVVKNDSDLNKARMAMSRDTEVEEEKLKALLTVDQVLVSVHESESTPAIVGDPFQQIIRNFKLGEKHELKFELLMKDLESLAIQLEYLGTTRNYSVFLKKDALQDLPTITSTQYAQEGRLESKIQYDLVLERLARTEQSFIPIVLNLPRSISCAFLDATTNARITQLKFNEELSKQTLNLEVSIPEKLDKELIDSNINFHVLIIRKNELSKAHKLLEKYEEENIPPEELNILKGNRVDLILIPRGTGKLDLLISNLYKEINQKENVKFKINILNSGSLELRHIKPVLDVPIDWECSIEPKELDVVAAGEKGSFQVQLIPVSDVSVGEYSLRIDAEGQSGYEKIEAASKNYTVRVVAETNIKGTLILVFVLLAMVLGIAIASVKISRR